MPHTRAKLTAFGIIACALVFVMGMLAHADFAKERKIQDMEKYNNIYSVLNDQQKREADSLPPVCSENEYKRSSCKERIELLEKAPASGGDTPQGIDGSGSIFFSGKIEVSRKNEKC